MTILICFVHNYLQSLLSCYEPSNVTSSPTLTAPIVFDPTPYFTSTGWVGDQETAQ